MENSISSDESSTCTPMIGFMTVWVDKTSGGGFVRSDAYTLIENYSKDYSTNEGVLSVSYIGTRPEVVMSDAELAFLNEGSAMAPGALAGIVVASVLSLLTVFALVAMKRRYKNIKMNRSEKISSSTNNVLVVGDDDDDNDVLEIVIDDDSTYSVKTECCTVDETIVSSDEKLPIETSQGEGGPSEGEGIELSYDQVINMRENILQ
jgi:hypothetical protein